MELWQFSIAGRGRGRLFPTVQRMRLAVRSVGRVLGSRGVLFSLVDDHGHFAVAGTRYETGRMASRVGQALAAVSVLPLESARIYPVEGRRHLDTLVPYYLRQTVKHGLSGHPAGWEGTCLAELVGVRDTPGFSGQTLAAAHPRLTLAAILREVELTPAAVRVCDDQLLYRRGPIAVVASAAAALGTSGLGRGRLDVLARACAAQLLSEAGFSTAAIAKALGVPMRTARWLRSRPIDEAVLALVRRRVSFDAVVAAAPPVGLKPREREALSRSPFRRGDESLLLAG